MTHRYPLDPLFALMGETPHAACKILRLAGRTQKEYRRDGVTAKVADRMAVRAGFHPYEVWPEMVDHDIAATAKDCAGCGEPYNTSDSRRRYCTPECRQRARWRRVDANRRRRDPEKAKARKQAWAQESTEYLRGYKRRWNEANRDAVNEHARTYRERERAS